MCRKPPVVVELIRLTCIRRLLVHAGYGDGTKLGQTRLTFLESKNIRFRCWWHGHSSKIHHPHDHFLKRCLMFEYDTLTSWWSFSKPYPLAGKDSPCFDGCLCSIWLNSLSRVWPEGNCTHCMEMRQRMHTLSIQELSNWAENITWNPSIGFGYVIFFGWGGGVHFHFQHVFLFFAAAFTSSLLAAAFIGVGCSQPLPSHLELGGQPGNAVFFTATTLPRHAMSMTRRSRKLRCSGSQVFEREATMCHNAFGKHIPVGITDDLTHYSRGVL